MRNDRLNHQGTKDTKYNENHSLIKSVSQIFFGFLGALGVLVVKLVSFLRMALFETRPF